MDKKPTYEELVQRVKELENETGERKQVKKALQETKRRFTTLIDNLPGMAYRCLNDQNWTMEFVSEGCFDLTDYKPDDLIGNQTLSYNDLIHSDDQDSVWMQVQDALAERKPFQLVYRIRTATGREKWVWEQGIGVYSEEGTLLALEGFITDITERKRLENALEKRIVALTQPLDEAEGIEFEELFNIDDIQKLQDSFAKGTRVASIITHPDGTPITKPSNFCRLCEIIIRQTDKGLKNCYHSDAVVGRHNPDGPIVQPCLSGGLWDAGASITVGGKHVANWLIGQVRNEAQEEEKMLEYAREIDADVVAFLEAFREVPIMSREQFGSVATALFLMANQLSASAYQNIQQARFITERKRAEEQLRLDETRLEKLLELSQMSEKSFADLTEFSLEEIVQLTKSDIGYLAFMNEDETVLTMHAWSKGAMEQCKIIDRPIEYPVAITGLWGEAVRQRKPVITNDYEAPNPQKKGCPEGHVEVKRHMNIPVFDGERIVAVAGVGNKQDEYNESDVRQLKLLMDGMWKIMQRKRTEEEMKVLMDSLDALVYVSDMETYELLFINEYGRNIWGDIIGKICWKMLQFRQSGPCEFCTNDKLIDENGAPTGVYVWEHYNTNNQAWYECRNRAIRWTNGRIVRMEIATNITERKRAQEMMIQTEKMMSIGGLAAGMAHEIKNPLGGVIQNAQVLNHRIFGDLPKNIKVAEECGISLESMGNYMDKRDIGNILDSIMDSGKRATEIIENMLSFSRKSESKFALHDVSVLLDQIVEIAKSGYDLKSKYDLRNIKIIREYAGNMPEVQCEATEIQQVFLNILKNGAEAMAEVETERPCFILRVGQCGDMACIEIEDNGPGMDESTRECVFKPFFTTKDVGVGTGLGLSVSYFIITENHGGTMEVESAPVKGAKFIIRLPIERNVL